MAGDYRTRSDLKPFRLETTETKDADMKRTRHIEITRYSRRVTVSQDGENTADPPAELSAIEVAAGEWEVIPPGDEQANAGRLRAVEPAALQISQRQISQRRPRFSLRKWFSRRF